MAGETLEKIRNVRIEKAKKLKELGINPYPAKSYKNIDNIEITNRFDELNDKEVIVAGRLMSFRSHGHLAFGHIQDQSGKVQLYIKDTDLANTSQEKQTIGFDDLELIDTGDFVEAKGIVTKTQRGEISVLVSEFRILTKSLRPLPDKWDGIKDKEMRYRRRYLDLVISPELKERFLRKEKFYQANRDFLKSRGFVEVEVPVLEHKTGGADARPFMTHHNDLSIDLYMRISSELYQKRLIGAGFDKVFTLGPNFRNEGISDEHLQEYYQVEWYWGYADYKQNMELVRDAIRYIANHVWGTTKFSTRGHEFDLSDEWTEVDYPGVIKEKLGVDIFEDSDEKLLAKIKELGIKLSGEINRNRVIDNLWKSIRKTISGPAFLVNEPKFMSPLAKAKADDDRLTERFHVIIAGSELGNGYSEINDPIDQLERFLDQEKMRNEGDDEAQMLDIDFIEMLEYGMPPVSGYGHSERIFWFLEDVTAREGTLFPLMRPEIDPSTKQIYGSVIREEKKVKVEEKKELSNKSDNNSKIPSREVAMKILEENVEDTYQKLHSRMVAAGMEGYATKFDAGAEDLWYSTGLLHDVDFYKWPENHPDDAKIRELTQNSYPESFYEAIQGHALFREVSRETMMAKTLLAVDELAGLFYALAKMRPDGFNMEAKSVKKKFKDKSFAVKINRDDIIKGIEEMGITLDEHIEFLIPIFKQFQSEL